MSNLFFFLFSCVHDHAVISDHLCAVVLISFSATRCSEKVLTCHTVQVSAEVRQADCPRFSKPGCWLYVKHIKRVLMPMRNTLLCQGFSLLCWWTVMWFCFSFLQFEKHFSLDILVKQISECVRCWEQCTFGLTQYVNVNISCAHIWTQTCFISMQTCDDFTALHLQRELFSHTWSLEKVGMMSSFLSQMPHSTGESSCPDSSHFWKYSGLSEGASCTVSSF